MNIKNKQPTLDTELKSALQSMENSPRRDPNDALRGRNVFLAEARDLKQTASFSSKMRHSKWIERFRAISPFRRKEGATMATQFISVLLILATLLGGTGAGTVYAAQSSMPDDLLYPVKTWSEEARLNLSTSPDKDVNLLLEFAGRRVEEILDNASEGGEEIEPLMTRLQEHVELAARLCDQTTDPLQTQQQIRQQLMNQQQLLDNAPETAQMQRTREMLQQKIHQIGQAPVAEDVVPLQEPDAQQPLEPPDRERLRTDQPEDAGNINANGYQEEQTPGGPNPNPDAAGQQSGGQNPQRTRTPMPGQSGQQQGPKDSNGSPGN